MTDSKKLRNLIKNTSVPLFIKCGSNWEIIKWDLEKWQEILGKETLQFRRGYIACSKNPQFENSTESLSLSFNEFIQYVKEHKNEWLYFDYKYLKTWFVNVPELRQNIIWNTFGFPECNVEDSTFWLGSAGAHTPCHQDTYGCNIVVQLYGRKRWYLFPPNEDLLPTRIPYEESSIYSKINMFGADIEDFKGITDCRSVTLNPGDVLIVPHKWWHYVENLELSISTNLWVNLPVDHEERINESIVQMLITQLTHGLPSTYKNYVFNPENDLEDTNLMRAFHLTQTCIQNYIESREKCSKNDTKELLNELNNIQVIAPLNEDEFKQVLEDQKQKIMSHRMEEVVHDEKKLIRKYLDVMLHNDVIEVIKRKLLNDL